MVKYTNLVYFKGGEILDKEIIKNKAIGAFKMMLFYKVINQALILFKSNLIAKHMVDSYNMPSYSQAIFFIGLLVGLINEAVLIGLVPIFTDLKLKHGDKEKNGRFEFLNNLVSLSFVFSLLLAFLAFFLGPKFIELRLDPSNNLGEVVGLFRLGLFMLIPMLTRTAYLAYLQSNHGFKSGLVGGVYYNLVLIVFLLFFRNTGLGGLMLATVVANLSYYAIIIPIMRKQDYSFNFDLSFSKERFGDFLNLFLELVVFLIILRWSDSIDLDLRKESYNLAKAVVDVPRGILIISIVTIAFPLFSENYNSRSKEGFKYSMSYLSQELVKFGGLMVLIMLLLSEPFIRGAYGGTVELEHMDNIRLAFRLATITMFIEGFMLLYVRAFIGMRNLKTPILVSLIGLSSKYFILKALARTYPEQAYPIALLLATGLMTGLYYMALRKKELV